MESMLNKIYCKDAIDFMQSIKAKSVDMVLTDPPYGIEFTSKAIVGRGNHDQLKNDGWEDFKLLVEPWIMGMKRIIKPGGIIEMFSGGGSGKFLCMPYTAMIAEKHLNIIQILV